MPVNKVAPTAPEALAIVPQQYTDRDTVTMVQRALLGLGYIDGGPADGDLSDKTKDVILSFRARNHLQLIPVIDDELLQVLKMAPQKSLPIEQATATKDEIAPKVEIVQIGTEVQKSAFWTKVWAFITGIPAGFITLAGLVIQNLDEASNAVAPLKTLLFDFQNINPLWWIALILIIAAIMAYQAMTISKLSTKLEEAAVEGYQRGTIRNDMPPKDEDEA